MRSASHFWSQDHAACVSRRGLAIGRSDRFQINLAAWALANRNHAGRAARQGRWRTASLMANLPKQGSGNSNFEAETVRHRSRRQRSCEAVEGEAVEGEAVEGMANRFTRLKQRQIGAWHRSNKFGARGAFAHSVEGSSRPPCRRRPRLPASPRLQPLGRHQPPATAIGCENLRIKAELKLFRSRRA